MNSYLLRKSQKQLASTLTNRTKVRVWYFDIRTKRRKVIPTQQEGRQGLTHTCDALLLYECIPMFLYTYIFYNSSHAEGSTEFQLLC